MDVNDPRWFRSIGAEKLMEAEEREKKEREEKEMGYPYTPYCPACKEERERREAEKRSFLEFTKNKSLGGEKDIEATELETMPSDTVVVDKKTGEKMILLKVTSTNCADYCIAVDKDGDVQCRSVDEIKVFLTDEQKKLLE